MAARIKSAILVVLVVQVLVLVVLSQTVGGKVFAVYYREI